MRAIIWIIATAIVVSSARSGERISLNNGDFENAESPLAGWKVQKISGSVDLQVSSGFWRTCTVKFNSASHSKVNIIIGAYGGPKGRCWIDNIRPMGFTVMNPSFEKLTPNRKEVVAWAAVQSGKTVHVSTDRVSEGQHSVQLFDPSYATEMIRLSQIVDVQPNNECKYTFDFYMEDDFYGGIRCSVLAADTSDYICLGGMAEDLDEVIADRSFAGSRQCRMKLAGGTASIFQEIPVPADTILEAAVQIRSKNLTGTVTLAIEDSSTDRVIAAVADESARRNWKPLQLRFTSPSRLLRVRVIGKGGGEILLDGVRLSPPQLLPMPQQVAWEKATAAFELKKDLSYSITGMSGELLDTSLAMLAKDLSAIGVELSQSKTASDRLTIVISADAPSAPKLKGEEAYFLRSNKDGIQITSQTERGAFYAIMTLLQLLSKNELNQPIVIGCCISDWPDLPWRSIFHSQSPEWMARRKFNRAEGVDSRP